MKQTKRFISIKGSLLAALVCLIMFSYTYINVAPNSKHAKPHSFADVQEEQRSIATEVKVVQYLVAKIFQSYDLNKEL